MTYNASVAPVLVGFYYNAEEQLEAAFRYDAPVNSGTNWNSNLTEGPGIIQIYDLAGRMASDGDYLAPSEKAVRMAAASRYV
jgi:hypothetical protein